MGTICKPGPRKPPTFDPLLALPLLAIQTERTPRRSEPQEGQRDGAWVPDRWCGAIARDSPLDKEIQKSQKYSSIVLSPRDVGVDLHGCPLPTNITGKEGGCLFVYLFVVLEGDQR